jgi:hypothetical protein
MPIMDGFQFVDEFQKLSKQLTDGVRIMLLTSSINPLDQQKSTTIPSIANYMNKPLTKEHLSMLQPV